MTTPKPTIVELSMNEWEDILQRAKAVLNEKDYQIVEAVVQSYAYVTDLLEDKRTTIDRLRKLLFGSGSEKTRDVVGTKPGEASSGQIPDSGAQAGDVPPPSAAPADVAPQENEATPAPGHGRHSADEYSGAERVPVTHGFLASGDLCPDCEKGKVYQLASPGVLVRIVGQAPVQAKVYELEKFRCNLCGKVFTADAPEGVGSEKYDATAGSMIALLKYGSGLPFHRLEGLQETLGIPLPASTQWDIVNAVAGTVEPAFNELIRQAAQGEVLHNDDTTVKILEFMGKRARKEVLADFGESPDTVGGHAVADPQTEATSHDDPPHREPSEGPVANRKAERRGLFTSGIVSTSEGRRIALFFSGRQHAGENLADVLAHRACDLPAPIQMCDALSRNLPPAFKTLLANCLAHGRRQFVDVADRFPDECRYVLESLGDVYKNDAIARERNQSPEERLAFHQTESEPILEKLRVWCMRQFEDRLVEPNSGLGAAISYLLKHWEKLTLFLRRPGAPLDNNIVERALKKAIVHRKNSLFYKTMNGAHVGDVFMSLIYTCQLCRADSFDYLTELQRHEDALSANPEQWMPWNYRDELRA
jgi:transposase